MVHRPRKRRHDAGRGGAEVGFEQFIGGLGIDSEHTSDFTWLAEVGASGRISDRFSWSPGYRWFDTDYESGSFAYDVNLNGPVTALAIRF